MISIKVTYLSTSTIVKLKYNLDILYDEAFSKF